MELELTFVNIEQGVSIGWIPESIAPRNVEKLQELRIGMFVAVLALASTDSRPRRHKLWMRIVDATAVDYDVQYTGELVIDTHLDLELGDRFKFGPEHILEWSTHEP